MNEHPSMKTEYKTLKVIHNFSLTVKNRTEENMCQIFCHQRARYSSIKRVQKIVEDLKFIPYQQKVLSGNTYNVMKDCCYICQINPTGPLWQFYFVVLETSFEKMYYSAHTQSVTPSVLARLRYTFREVTLWKN